MSSFRRRLMMTQGGGETPKFEIDPCIYTTTSANQSVKIINKKEASQRIYLEDGTELDINGQGELSYTFNDIGDHKVWIELKSEIDDFYNCFKDCSLTNISEQLFFNNLDAKSFMSCFYNCSMLKSIPEKLFYNNTIATEFMSCFFGCYSLTNIPNKLFSNNKLINSFSSCFSMCTGITGNCPIDNDGTPIYNRSGNGKEGYEIVKFSTLCFYNCTNMSDYNLIPSDWK